jgi:hypothetical protein
VTDLVQSLSEALPYVSRLAGQTIVVKIGGSTLGSEDTTLEDVVTLKSLQVDVVVVHGGGAAITEWLKRIDKRAVFVDGLRVTDPETMQVVTMTLAGQVNKELVAQLQARGGRAIGLSGVDGGLLRGQVKDPRLGAVGPQTCGILIEVVQGESGVHIASPEYVKGLRDLCDERGILLLLDEIQTGIGRTGKFLGYEHYGVEPDAFSLAKGLGGGVPIGACVAKEQAAVLEPSDHGSTFGGNPLACAAGVATVRTILKEKLHENAAEVGGYFLGKLEALKAKNDRVVAARGKGLMLAFDLADESAPKVVNEALGLGLILNATGPKTVRMVPPLILTKPDVDEAMGIIEEALRATQ